MAIFNQLSFVRDEIKKLPEFSEKKPLKGKAVWGFFDRINYAIHLAFKEKELLVFALLQWAAIGLGYFLWVQMLDWIPEEVWKSAPESDEGSIVDWILLAWSFVCVGVAAFPIGILSASMGAVHFLHRQERESTVAMCLRVVMPQAWRLWAFHWIDGWITVLQILERLPKKNDRTTPAQRALSEALYYAWKLGISGVLPGLVSGHNLYEAGKGSIKLVKNKFAEVATLRLGYSLLCWIVGIGTYIGTILFFIVFDNLIPDEDPIYGHIYTFYFWAAVPILIGVGFVMMFLRPIYLITLCDIYSDYIKEQGQDVSLPDSPPRSISALVAFCVLCILISVVVLYRNELGIVDMLSTPYITNE